METVLTAVIILFIVLFGALTLAEAVVQTQDELQMSWQDMNERWETQARTELSLVDAYTSAAGTTVNMLLRNSGATRLADFKQWDVIVQYYDSDDSQHIAWLPYREAAPGINEWTVSGIYLDSTAETTEAIEPGIFNPGEELLVRFRIAPSVEAGAAIQVAVITAQGVGRSAVFTGNMLPAVITNNTLNMVEGGEAPIAARLLAAADEDDPPAALVYTVLTPPTQGELNLGETFSQADIDTGRLSYTHSGSGDDSFQFSLTDGADVDGPHQFTIHASIPPAVITNTGLTMTQGGNAAIYYTMLEASDADNLPEEIQFEVTSPPQQGTLSRLTFTQADLNNGMVNYTHTGTGSDTFEFTVSDGVATTSPVAFAITIQ